MEDMRFQRLLPVIGSVSSCLELFCCQISSTGIFDQFFCTETFGDVDSFEFAGLVKITLDKTLLY